MLYEGLLKARRKHFAARAALKAALRKQGVDLPEESWILLKAIQRNGPMTNTQLCAAVDLAPSATSRSLSRMSSKGLVAKELHENNVVYVLQDDGKTIAEIVD